MCLDLKEGNSQSGGGGLDIKDVFPVLPLGFCWSVKWQRGAGVCVIEKDDDNNLCLRVQLTHQRSIMVKQLECFIVALIAYNLT